jgi:hypothetical protein
MVSTNKLIENIAGGVMLGSFAAYGKGCCNSAKQASEEEFCYEDTIKYSADNPQQLVFNNEKFLANENAKKDIEARERIITKNIYVDRPVEKIKTVTETVVKRKELFGTIRIGDKKFFDINLLSNLAKLIKEVTGEPNVTLTELTEDSPLINIYNEERRKLYNSNINYDIVRDCIANIIESEIKIYDEVSENKFDRSEIDSIAILNKYFLDFNKLVLFILVNTYEKMLINMYSGYRYIEQGALKINRRVYTPIYTIRYFNDVYAKFANLKSLINPERMKFEFENVIDLSTKVQKFSYGVVNTNHNLQWLSKEITINRSKLTEENKESIIFVLKYATMKSINDFIFGLYNKIFTKFSYLSFDTTIDPKIALYADADYLQCIENPIQKSSARNSGVIYKLINTIANEDFEFLKRLYDELYKVNDNLFGNYIDNTVHINPQNCCTLCSLGKLYNLVINNSRDTLCKFFIDNVFNLKVVGYNDSADTSRQVSYEVSKCLNMNLDENSYLIANNNLKTFYNKVDYTYIDSVKPEK